MIERPGSRPGSDDRRTLTAAVTVVNERAARRDQSRRQSRPAGGRRGRGRPAQLDRLNDSTVAKGHLARSDRSAAKTSRATLLPTTRETSPASRASNGSRVRPERSSSRPRALRAWPVIRRVPPHPEKKPRRTPGCAKLARRVACVKSQEVARSKPPPNAGPSTMAPVGAGNRESRSKTAAP